MEGHNHNKWCVVVYARILVYYRLGLCVVDNNKCCVVLCARVIMCVVVQAKLWSHVVSDHWREDRFQGGHQGQCDNKCCVAMYARVIVCCWLCSVIRLF